MNEVIAITGYPGCGKTSIGKALQSKYRVIQNLYKGTVSIRKISRKIILGELPVFIIGFWAHLLPSVTKIIFIRAPLEHHRSVFEARNYSLYKTIENLEAIQTHFIENQLKKIKNKDIFYVENNLTSTFEEISIEIEKLLWP